MKEKLNKTHPDLCRLWHDKNTLLPSDVTYGSKIKVWWQCPISEDHQWETSVSCQVRYPGCPFCSGQKTATSNSLATLRPDIAQQWHPSLNKLTPNDVTISSARKIWWMCKKGHNWEARVFARTKNKSGCPFCVNKKAGNDNSLEVTHPHLIKEWHPTLNNLEIKDVVAGSGKKVWWKCSKCNEEWLASIIHRSEGVGCPYCAGQKVCENNSLAKTHPFITQQWHPILNGNLIPNDVVANSHKKIWWFCNKASDHIWEARIADRTNGSTCPCCLGQKVVLSNCLFTTHPLIAKEWHLTKNHTVTPQDVTYACNKAYWFQCSVNNKHNWRARIDARTRTGGTGCPICCASKGEKAIKEFLEVNKIPYVRQYYFQDCKSKRKLPFDFAILKDDKVIGVIEFQGRQHYYPVAYFGGEIGHQFTKNTDKIKFNYCKVNKIPFLSIPFWNIDVIHKNLKNFVEMLL